MERDPDLQHSNYGGDPPNYKTMLLNVKHFCKAQLLGRACQWPIRSHAQKYNLSALISNLSPNAWASKTLTVSMNKSNCR